MVHNHGFSWKTHTHYIIYLRQTLGLVRVYRRMGLSVTARFGNEFRID